MGKKPLNRRTWGRRFTAFFKALAPLVLGLTALGLAACGNQNQGDPNAGAGANALIPRQALFGDPQRASARISPRGDMIAFLAPSNGAMNVWVAPLDTLGQARVLTAEAGGVNQFAWAYDGRTLLYLRESGDVNARRLMAVDTGGGAARALTPDGARAEIVGLSPRDPAYVVVALNDRDAAWPDLVRYDIATGARTTLYRNIASAARPRFASYVVDMDNTLRLGVATADDGGLSLYSLQSDGSWPLLFTVAREDALNSAPLAFEANGETFLMLDSTGRDRAALVRVDAATGAKTVLGESPRADVIDAWLNPITNAPEAYSAEYLRRDWRALDAEAQADLDYLDQNLQGEINVVSRSQDGRRWIVTENDPATPTRSYLYDRSDPAHKRLTLLFRHRPDLENYKFQPMIPVEIDSRDGLTLVSYMTLPPGADRNNDTLPDRPVPLVIIPHDGPWARDSFGFNGLHQWLANRGYAALSVNFRGSSGLGNAFLAQGDHAWGAAMQDDLLDAARWAVDNGVTQAGTVALLGEGYGGYAAAAGLAFTPEQYACAAAIAPPLSLLSLTDAVPRSAVALRAQMLARVGDPRDAEDRERLRERSIVTHANSIARPFLIALGGRGVAANRQDADAVMRDVRGRGVGAVQIVFPNEGDVIAMTANRIASYAAIEHFLGNCLHGRAEATGPAFQNVNMQVFQGADLIPGLQSFARRALAPLAAPAAVAETPAETRDLNAAYVPPPISPAPVAAGNQRPRAAIAIVNKC